MRISDWSSDVCSSDLAPASRLRDLYDRYYRPERATLVMVGDFDQVAVEAKIKARFADWRGRGPAGADPALGPIDYDRAPAAPKFLAPAASPAIATPSFKSRAAPPANSPDDLRHRERVSR